MSKENIYMELKNIHKNFGKVHALNNISFDIKTGEILSIVGDNGAGKSTLLNILSGNTSIDSGTILIKNMNINNYNNIDAINMGISTLYQDLALVDTKDSVFNVFLGKELKKRKYSIFTDKKKMIEITENLIEELNLSIPDIYEEVGRLSGGQRQGLAIARAIYSGGELILLDEPTAAMGIRESKEIIDIINKLKEEGKGIVLISHDLSTVYKISDRFLVLKHGKQQGFIKKDDISYNELIYLVINDLTETKETYNNDF